MDKTTDRYKYAGLFITLILPVLTGFIRVKFSGNNNTDILLKEGIIWMMFLAVLLIARYGEKEPLDFSAHISPATTLAQSVIILVSLFVFAICCGIIYLVLLKGHPPSEPMMERLWRLPPWIKMILAVRAGVVEETFFRAYAMGRIKQLTNNNALAFIIPLLFFAGGHIAYGSVYHVVVTFFIGALLAVCYMKTKNLAANIAGHTFYDLIIFLAKHG